MFYDIYSRLCEKAGISRSRAAQEMGLSNSTVTKWKKSGAFPSGETLSKVASYFGVSLDYLLDETDDPYDWNADPDARLANVYGPRWNSLMEKHHGDTSAAWEDWQALEKDQAEEARKMWRADQETALKNKNAPAAESCASVDWKQQVGATPCNPAQVVPLLGTVRAGLPMYAVENIEGYIPIRQTDGAKYFWLNIRGDSMNAAGMNEGDQILVREQPEVENGEIAVVLVNGDEATVKCFRQEGDLVILTPRSSNPAHQPQVYDLKKTPVQVLGRVVECRKVY